MEDVTDTVFRRIVAEHGRPDLFFTEFINADGLCSAGRDAVIHRLKYTKTERPIIAQIWGNSPDTYLKACQDIQTLGFDGIDINMGCPVKKITKNGACSALIENPTLAAELIRSAREGARGLPVSVKTRIGFKTKKTEQWITFLLEQGLDALTIHGRIAKDMSDIPADWAEIGKGVILRNRISPKTVIIGNGDVMNMRQAASMVQRHRVDGIMIGRGILHNLFLFRERWAGSAMAPRFADLKPETKLQFLDQHISLFREEWGDKKNFNIMKKFVKVYVSDFEHASQLRNQLVNCNSYDNMLRLIRVSAS